MKNVTEYDLIENIEKKVKKGIQEDKYDVFIIRAYNHTIMN